MALLDKDFDPVPESAGAVRRFVEAVIPGETRLDDILLAVSELATNVIQHAKTVFTVRLVTDDQRIRIEVSNGSSVIPAVKALADRHWGLRLVEELADRWGIESTDSGKTVWAEFSQVGTQTDRQPDVPQPEG